MGRIRKNLGIVNTPEGGERMGRVRGKEKSKESRSGGRRRGMFLEIRPNCTL